VERGTSDAHGKARKQRPDPTGIAASAFATSTRYVKHRPQLSCLDFRTRWMRAHIAEPARGYMPDKVHHHNGNVLPHVEFAHRKAGELPEYV
ncbi:MAG: hypothetical protein WCD79_11990, partial [Chthoniobacteraceae bacterium]